MHRFPSVTVHSTNGVARDLALILHLPCAVGGPSWHGHAWMPTVAAAGISGRRRTADRAGEACATFPLFSRCFSSLVFRLTRIAPIDPTDRAFFFFVGFFCGGFWGFLGCDFPSPPSLFPPPPPLTSYSSLSHSLSLSVRVGVLTPQCRLCAFRSVHDPTTCSSPRLPVSPSPDPRTPVLQWLRTVLWSPGCGKQAQSSWVGSCGWVSWAGRCEWVWVAVSCG